MRQTKAMAAIRAAVLVIGCLPLPAIVIQSAPAHLRAGSNREWSSFPESAPRGAELSITFRLPAANERESSLLLRQFDVKDTGWAVSINGTKLGSLIADERDMMQILAVPPGTLRAGDNVLTVSGKAARIGDDIEVRSVRLELLPVSELLRQATVDIEVASDQAALPLRITVVDSNRTLVPFAPLRTDAREAVRTGVVYTADGRTRIGLPAGDYRIYASRGFDYSAPSQELHLSPGQTGSVKLRIVREVVMPGMVSLDTHVHTLELSGHGDASVEERVLTAAGEGLDALAVTEHNVYADYLPTLRKLGLEKWLVAIQGSEFTTPIGHFNIFPVDPTVPYPNVRETDWSKLMDSVSAPDRVLIQNHPRDLHSSYRPFDPSHHTSSLGENRNGRPFRSNAMEVVNSGAMSSDPLQLVRDWMGLLTRGLHVAAIGASDTHTVDFVPIGQARTYVEESGGAVRNLLEGRNVVSYGLAADLRQTGQPSAGSVPIEVTVFGPSWSAATEVIVYGNGIRLWSRGLDANRKPGVKFSEVISVPLPHNDAALVAVATGPAILEPFWEVRKPYQPTSPDWNPIVLGVSRALWIDSDHNLQCEAPLEVARRLVKLPLAQLVSELSGYDGAVAKHAANLLGSDRAEVRAAFSNGPPAVRAAWSELMQERMK